MRLFSRIIKKHPMINFIFIDKLEIIERSLKSPSHVFLRHAMTLWTLYALFELKKDVRQVPIKKTKKSGTPRF